MAGESLAELVQWAPDVYGFRWQQHVAVFIVTDEGVILVDPIGQVNTRTPHMLKEAIRAVTEQPVRYVIYSHWGADHGMGGAVFADTARFVAHRHAVERIQATGDPNSPLPTMTFDAPTSITLGGKKIDLYPSDLQPTDDYIVVHYPEQRVAMLVDLVQPKSAPFRTLLGHPDRVVEHLQWLHDNLEFDMLISGHTTPSMIATKADVLEQRRYYLDLSDAIEAARSTGAADGSPAMVEAVRARLAPTYGDWRRFEDIAQNIDGMIGWRAGKNLRNT